MTLKERWDELEPTELIYMSLDSGSGGGFPWIMKKQDFDFDKINVDLEARFHDTIKRKKAEKEKLGKEVFDREAVRNILKDLKKNYGSILSDAFKEKIADFNKESDSREKRLARVRKEYDKIKDMEFVRLEDREILDWFLRDAEPEHIGTGIKVEGIESMRGFWLYEEATTGKVEADEDV